MGRPSYHQLAVIQIPRDRRGLVIGHMEERRSTAKTIVRVANGDAWGDVLAALLIRH